MTTTKPDVDLTDGAFYAGDSRSVYKWMRENEPVFRDRNGLAAAATYQAVIEAERQPELFSNAGGIRPDQNNLSVPLLIPFQGYPLGLAAWITVNLGALLTALWAIVSRAWWRPPLTTWLPNLVMPDSLRLGPAHEYALDQFLSAFGPPNYLYGRLC